MQSRALINPLPKKSGIALRATIQNPRPRKYASDADRQKAFRDRQAMIQVRVAPKAVETFDEIAETLGYSRQEVVYALLMKGLMSLGNWETVGLPIDWQRKMPQFKLPKYEDNPIMRKATPAQLAARERFAEMARSGAFKRKAKAAPKRKKNPISDIAQTIYEQLGADRFAFMTGAKNIVGLDEGLMFSIPRNQSPYNKVRITLTPDDLYNVEFFKMNRLGDISKQTEYPGMYADQLRALFTRVTGLETSLGTMGRRSNPAKKTVSQKISQLTREGYPQKQAVAIALNEQRKGKVKKNPISYGLDGTVKITDTYERSVAASRNLAEHYANQLRMRGRDDVVYVVFGITPEAKPQAGRYRNGVTITLEPRDYEIAYAFHPTQGEISRQLKAQRDAERRAYAREKFGRMKNPMKFYEVINTVTGESEGIVKAADSQLAFDVFARTNGYKNFAEMKQKEKTARNEFLMVETNTKRRSNPAEAKERKPRVVLITNPQARTAKVKRSVNPNFQFAVQAQKRYPGNAVGYETVAGFPTKAQAQDYVNALLKAYPKGLTLRIMEGNA